MTNQELEVFLGLTPEEAAIIIPRLTPQRREMYERMAAVETELHLWQQGVGPKPQGVIVLPERKQRRRRR